MLVRKAFEFRRYPDKEQQAALKRSTGRARLREVDSQVLQQSRKDLDRAFRSFFVDHSRSPPIKSRRAKQAIRDPQRVKVNAETRRTDLPKVGWVRTRFHRPMEGKVKNVTVSRDKSGRYFGAFLSKIICRQSS